MKKELTHKLSLHSSDPSRIIEVVDLTKDFGRGIGVFDVTFYVKKGEILGKHTGLYNYTIGQRKGLGISYKSPLFVIGFNPKKNEVIVGEENELLR